MNVSYSAPLLRAWARTQRMLFRPFNIVTWLVLGFAAFLSEGMMGRGGRYGYHVHPGEFGFPLVHEIHGLLSGLLWTGLGILVLTAALILVVVLMWVNSRGRFIFLDDVVRERAAIVEPWRRFARLGNSLFLWWLGFLLACVAVGVVVALPFLASLVALWAGDHFNWAALGALWTMLAVATPLAIVIAYTVLFAFDFVVPIMYRQDVGVTVAWGRFLSLLRAHPGSFLLYGLFVLGLWIVITAVLAVIGLMSCCVGFILFSLPYVSSVVLLPVFVTLRGLGPEFLGQFGPDYRLFAEAPSPAPPPPAPAAPAPGATPPPPASTGSPPEAFMPPRPPEGESGS